MSTFEQSIYLAAPYSHESAMIRNQRVTNINYVASILTKAGFFVYSPITHNHQLSVEYDVAGDWNYWHSQCMFFIDKMDCLAVLMIDGWSTSVGVNNEILHARNLGKKVVYIGLSDMFELEIIRTENTGNIQDGFVQFSSDDNLSMNTFNPELKKYII